MLIDQPHHQSRGATGQLGDSAQRHAARHEPAQHGHQGQRANATELGRNGTLFAKQIRPDYY